MTDDHQQHRTDVESVEEFRLKARTWLAENFPKSDGLRQPLRPADSDEEELAAIQRERDLQRLLFDGGFAGVCVPHGVRRPRSHP